MDGVEGGVAARLLGGGAAGPALPQVLPTPHHPHLQVGCSDQSEVVLTPPSVGSIPHRHRSSLARCPLNIKRDDGKPLVTATKTTYYRLEFHIPTYIQNK